MLSEFARIFFCRFHYFCSSTFCPNFRPNSSRILPEFLASNFFFLGGGGIPPPPPASYAYALDCVRLFQTHQTKSVQVFFFDFQSNTHDMLFAKMAPRQCLLEESSSSEERQLDLFLYSQIASFCYSYCLNHIIFFFTSIFSLFERCPPASSVFSARFPSRLLDYNPEIPSSIITSRLLHVCEGKRKSQAHLSPTQKLRSTLLKEKIVNGVHEIIM